MEREEQRLRNSYRKCSKEQLLTLFPDRTWEAIKIRASRLNISRKTVPWTEEEDLKLFKSYKKILKEELLSLLPGRTWEAIKSRTSRLNIPRKGMPYTPDEDSLLLMLRSETDLTYKQISLFFEFRDHNSLRFRLDRIRHMKNRVDILDKKVKGIRDGKDETNSRVDGASSGLALGGTEMVPEEEAPTNSKEKNGGR